MLPGTSGLRSIAAGVCVCAPPPEPPPATMHDRLPRYHLLRRLEVEGSGFLYKQVRHMTGALLAVGSGLLAPDAIAMALATGPLARSGADRNAARGWMVAEAKGLCLQEVVYFPSSPLPLAAKL